MISYTYIHESAVRSTGVYDVLAFANMYLSMGDGIAILQPYCGGSLPCYKYAPFQDVEQSGNSAQYEWLARDITKVPLTVRTTQRPMIHCSGKL